MHSGLPWLTPKHYLMLTSGTKEPFSKTPLKGQYKQEKSTPKVLTFNEKYGIIIRLGTLRQKAQESPSGSSLSVIH